MRKQIAVSILVGTLVGLVGGALVAGPGDAWVLNGCKFPGSNPQLEYKFVSVGSTWTDAFNAGQQKWDTKTPGYGGWFTENASGTDTEIYVYDANYSETWWGLAEGGCDSGGGQPWYNDKVNIKFNLSTAGSMNTTERRLVAIHEMGHGLGLAHSSLGCSDPVVMRSDPTYAYDNCGTSDAPYANDVAGVDVLY